MLAWLMYVMMVTLLLSVATYIAERTARLRRQPTRWVWIGAIVASLLLPCVMSSVSIQVPNVFTPSASQHLHALREVTTQYLSPAFWIDGGGNSHTDHPQQWRSYDTLLKQAWALTSLGMTLVLVTTGVTLFLRKRRWPQRHIGDADVYLTEDIGPAVVGLLSPRIVIPAWVLQTTPTQQQLVLAHEKSHLEARDPLLFTVALCLLVAMPWNLSLWWQLHRLRRAIEVDCDARVLKLGHAVESYGETLIEVGARQSTSIGAVAAMSESASFLEERIRIMVSKPAKWAKSLAMGLTCVSLVVAAVAAQVGPPNGTTQSQATASAPMASDGARKEIMLPASALPNYVGDYKLLGHVLRVTSDGSRLMAQLTGQPSFQIYPQSQTEFFYKIVNAQITFSFDASGQARSLVLHQNGADINAPRIDAAAAQLIETGMQERVRFQQATPGSEVTLKRTLDALAAGKPNYSEMSPALASGMKAQLEVMQPMLTQLGAVQSLQFKGVGDEGWDIFEVKHQNGTVRWRIALGDDGVINGLFLQRLP